MFHFHAAGDARPSWARDAEEICANSAEASSYLRRLYLPLRNDGEVLVVAIADSSVENVCWVRTRYDAVRLVIVPRTELLKEISRRFEIHLTDGAILSLAREQPELSARQVVSHRQAIGFAVAAIAATVALLLKPFATIAVFIIAMTLIFIAGTFFRVLLSWFGGLPREPVDAAQSSDTTLPVYSILVPLYREAKIVPDLKHALLSLSYPRDRLDIKIIVEADDIETVRACEEFTTLSSFDVLCVPPSLPRTKPKAVNFALRYARGEYLVIYDAEDRPEPDQLLRAVGCFRRYPRGIACLQARLAFHNQSRWLTNGLMAQTPQVISAA